MNPKPSDLAASRRDFLAAGAAVFAGTALAGSSLAAVQASSSDELKVALVGCGARGAGAAVHALSTEGPVKLWAAADAFQDRLETCLESLRRGSLKGRYDVEASKD